MQWIPMHDSVERLIVSRSEMVSWWHILWTRLALGGLYRLFLAHTTEQEWWPCAQLGSRWGGDRDHQYGLDRLRSIVAQLDSTHCLTKIFLGRFLFVFLSQAIVGAATRSEAC
jgi:hypothetical protein